MDIKDRIAKLLALGTSPNENEAQEAMLKAQQLMAQHKLSMADFEGKPDATVIQHKTDIECSKRYHPWTISLASVIAKNHCCSSYFHRSYGKQKVHIGLIGYEEDVQLTESILRYALDSIQSWIEADKKKNKGIYTVDEMRSARDSYAKGFIKGVETAYRKQTEEHQEWGMVLVVPQEVTDIVDSFKKEPFVKYAQVNHRLYNKGFSDGVKFNPSTKLTSH